MYGIRNKITGKIVETRSTLPYKKCPDGCEPIFHKGIVSGDTFKNGVITKEVIAPVVNKKLEALKALDASSETGALKTVIEFLQR